MPHSKRDERAPIDVGDDILDPRGAFAARLNISERTVARMGLPTVYVGGHAHILRKAGLQAIAAQASRSNRRRERAA
jgi:hypothetical protein